MSSHARTRLSRRTSCLPISQSGDHASKSTSVPAKAGCGRNGAKRQTKTTVCLSRLNGRPRAWRRRGGVAASPEEWLVRLSSASRRGGPVDDEGADDVGVAYAND